MIPLLTIAGLVGTGTGYIVHSSVSSHAALSMHDGARGEIDRMETRVSHNAAAVESRVTENTVSLEKRVTIAVEAYEKRAADARADLGRRLNDLEQDIAGVSKEQARQGAVLQIIAQNVAEIRNRGG